MLTDAEVAVFLAALRATGRGALRRWLADRGIKPDADQETIAPAVAAWRATPHFSSPGLRHAAERVLAASRGGEVSLATPFPAMLWQGGAANTKGGCRLKMNLGEFVEYILVARQNEVAPKRCGWVVQPTTNTDGNRTNASTAAVHALFVDCDGRGEWATLASELDRLRIAHILYQSGGWAPGRPKWRAILPLAAPWSTTSPERASSWRSAYAKARVILGALGDLTGEGFDPATDVPAIPWFVTERRDALEPPRAVEVHLGAALDLARLDAVLPDLPQTDESDDHDDRHTADPQGALEKGRIVEIVQALVQATASVPSGRRELYLALPGALLDRGLEPDDVLAIVSHVSAAYPHRGSAKQRDDNHRDNLRCARTTIGRWERGEPYTRIGTLVDGWPEVVAAIDRVLPHPDLLLGREIAERMRGRAQVAHLAPGTPPPIPSVPASVDPRELRRRLGALRSRKLRSKSFDDIVRGTILDALLKGDDLVPYVEGEGGKRSSVYLSGKEKPVDRDQALAIAMGMAAYRLPVGTPFDAVREVARASLHKMLTSGERLDALMEKAEKLFTASLGKRVRVAEEREAAHAAAKRAAVEHLNPHLALEHDR